MEQKTISQTDLLLNSDGSIYHLNLQPEELADTVIIVGDQDRVEKISCHFDDIEVKKKNREIVTHTGNLNHHRLSVMSTGMGPDNIDIVITELDALVNVDLKNRRAKDTLKSLRIVRVGTTGALHEDIPCGGIVLSTHGMGFDNVMSFYEDKLTAEEQMIAEIAEKHFASTGVKPYVSKGVDSLRKLFSRKGIHEGITATCGGFYGPQARTVRAKTRTPDLLDKMTSFRAQGHRITNFEMETSAIYGLSKVLGHEALSVNVAILNRVTDEVLSDKGAAVEKAIEEVLRVLTA